MKNKIIIIVFFLFLTLLVTFPAVFSLGNKMIGDGGDGYQFLGFQYVAKKLFFAGQFPFSHTNFWRYPYGVEFQNIVDSMLLMGTGILFYQISSNPILVYNLSVLAFVFLNLTLSYISFRTFFPRLTSIIGSIIYGLSFYSLGKLGGHMNLFLISSFLLFFTSLFKIYKEKGSRGSFAYLTLGMILIPLASLQFPLFLLGSLPFIGVITWYFFPEEIKELVGILWNKKWFLLSSVLISLAVVLAFLGTKIMSFFQGTVPYPTGEFFSIPPINFLVPNVYLKTISALVTNDTKQWIDYTVFLGYMEIVLFVAALFVLKNTKVKKFLIVCFIALFILTLGKQDFLQGLWPYQYLFHFFPFRGIIEPGRFIALALIPMVFLILLFLEKIKKPTLLILILSLLIFERLPMNFNLNPSLYSPGFIQKVRELPTNAVLNLPVYKDWWNGQRYDVYSAYYDKPIVEGYIQWSGESEESLTLLKKLSDYACVFGQTPDVSQFNPEVADQKKEEIKKTLKTYDIRVVVLHKDLGYTEGPCELAQLYIDTLLSDPEFTKAYEDKEKVVYYLNK